MCTELIIKISIEVSSFSNFLAELREAIRSCIYRLQDGGYSCTQCDFTSKYQGKISFNLPLKTPDFFYRHLNELLLVKIQQPQTTGETLPRYS